MAEQIPDWARDTSAPAPAAPAAPQASGSPDWAQDASAPVAAKPVSKPFKDEDFPEYQRLVRARGTTPEQLSSWLEQRGYGRSTNAAEVLSFQRKNPRAQILNTYTQNPADPAPAPQPDGMPQPGTSTDWLPDAIQGPIERLGLSLGIIDPKTYYGLGNYGPNARAPSRLTTVSNPALPSWGQRFVRSMGETFDPAGGGINAYILRANKDIADDDAIRHYGSDHNWTGDQIDAAIKEAQRQRDAAYAETRAQREIRDNDEVRRAEGLGVDEKGKARSSWGGYLSRGSADLAGGIVGDANPTYVFAPEIKGASAVVERAAPVVGRLIERVLPSQAAKVAVPVAERVVTAAAPTAGRAAGQGAVQATTNLGTQADEVSRGLKENVDPVEVILHGALGAGFQGGAEVLGRLTPKLSQWIVGKLREPSALDRLTAEGITLDDLPAGVSAKDAVRALQQLRGIRDEAAAFQGTPEPKPTDAFPTDASRAADAEAWGRSLGEPTPRPAEPTPPVEPAAPVAEPGPTDMTPQPSKAEFNTSEPAPAEPAPISKKEANAQFEEATGTPDTQTPAQWGKSLKEQAAAWRAARDTGSTEPAPSAATRNATAEAPPTEATAPAAEPVPDAAPPVDDVVTRLTDALKAAGKVRPEQDALTSKARKERLAASRAAFDAAGGGVAGRRAAMAALAGEVPKADFEAVAPKFSAEDMDELVNRVATSPKLQGYETIGALQGLDKLMNGKLPAANELDKLGKVFPSDFVKAALKHRSASQKGLNLFSQVWNLPRSIVSTLDASIPLRQGVFMVSRPEFYTSFGKMLKQMGSEKYFEATQAALRERPNFQLMEDSGLAIHDNKSLDSGARPEQFRSDWAGKIPVFKHLYNISKRGAEGFSNQLRADVFDRLYAQYKRVGIELAEQPDLARKVADYINIATGRGKVPFDKVGTAVGDTFFSPQFMSSRIQLATLPARILAERGPVLRGNMIRDLAGFSSIAATVIALAKLIGAEVNDNPLSTDWGKIKVPKKEGVAGAAQMAPALFGVGVQSFKGQTRYDIFGGMQQYLHLAAVLAMNERTTTNGRTIEFGKGYKPETRATTIARFLRSKESPAASFINDALEGSDYIGNKFDLRNALLSRLIPFSAQDIAQGYNPDPDADPGKAAPKAAPTSAPANTEVPDWAK